MGEERKEKRQEGSKGEIKLKNGKNEGGKKRGDK